MRFKDIHKEGKREGKKWILAEAVLQDGSIDCFQVELQFGVLVFEVR